MFKPFAKEAQVWEERALELRRKLGVPLTELLDPLALALEVGLLVVDAELIRSLLDEEVAKTVFLSGKDSWSGGVYAAPLPSGEMICIINPTHGECRKKITLMEEISHIHLHHTPTKLRAIGTGQRFRDYDTKQEREAYGVGCAALLPWGTFFHDLNAGENAGVLAEKYQVSEQLIHYRIKTSGAYKLYKARQRAA
jgi:Zn-dependent peptidase ImmA (M78 family)